MSGHPHDVTEGVLLGLGFSEDEDRVYRLALSAPVVETRTISREFGWPEAQASAVLDSLLARGLVLEIARGGHAAVDPRSAVRILAERQAALVDRVRSSLGVLGDVFDSARREPSGSATRVVSGAAAIGDQLGRLATQLTTDFCGFDKPPYVTTPGQSFVSGAISRGVSWRTVYCRESTEPPGRWEHIREDAALGDDARLTPYLPVKLAIADRRHAVVSLGLDPNAPEALVTDAPPLVAALCSLFEHFWDRAIPVTRVHAVEDLESVRPAADIPTPGERELLTLLALDHKDEAIARHLGVSLRTARRRIHGLLDRLGVASRFSAGLEAARRGWL